MGWIGLCCGSSRGLGGSEETVVLISECVCECSWHSVRLKTRHGITGVWYHIARKVRGYLISHYLVHFSVAVLSSRMSALRWRLLIIRLIRQEHKPPVPGPIIGSKYGTLTELGPDSTCAFVGPLRARPARTHPPHRNIPYHTARRRWKLRYRTMVVGGAGPPSVFFIGLWYRSVSFSHSAPGFTCTMGPYSNQVLYGIV